MNDIGQYVVVFVAGGCAGIVASHLHIGAKIKALVAKLEQKAIDASASDKTDSK